MANPNSTDPVAVEQCARLIALTALAELGWHLEVRSEMRVRVEDGGGVGIATADEILMYEALSKIARHRLSTQQPAVSDDAHAVMNPKSGGVSASTEGTLYNAASARISAGDKDWGNSVERSGTQAQPRDDVRDEKAWRKFELWFFRECNEGTRRHLYSLFDMPVDEIRNHGIERIVFKRIRKALTTAKVQEPGSEREAIVAWLREQSDKATDIAMKAAINSPSERDHIAGAVAIKRAADAIERGDHLNGGARHG